MNNDVKGPDWRPAVGSRWAIALGDNQVHIVTIQERDTSGPWYSCRVDGGGLTCLSHNAFRRGVELPVLPDPDRPLARGDVVEDAEGWLYAVQGISESGEAEIDEGHTRPTRLPRDFALAIRKRWEERKR